MSRTDIAYGADIAYYHTTRGLIMDNVQPISIAGHLVAMEERDNVTFLLNSAKRAGLDANIADFDDLAGLFPYLHTPIFSTYPMAVGHLHYLPTPGLIMWVVLPVHDGAVVKTNPFLGSSGGPPLFSESRAAFYGACCYVWCDRYHLCAQC
eukprot:678961-Rhodomonas_salina.2